MRNFVRGLVLLNIGLLAGLFVRDAVASRNSSGTMSAISGPYIAGTTISSSIINARYADIENELTDSLSRSGKGAMTAALRGIAGTAAAPAFSFTADTGLGFWRAGAGDLACSVGGVKQFDITTAGITLTSGAFIGNLTGNLTGNVTGNLSGGTITANAPSSFTGSASHAPINLVPQAAPSTPSNGEVWVDTGSNHVLARVNGATQTLATSPLARSDMPAVGQQISASCGNFNNAGGAAVDVTNLAVTITTSGRPVILMVVPDGNGTINPAFITSGNNVASIWYDRGGAHVADWALTAAAADAGIAKNTGLMFIDPVGAGTYTYKVRVNPGGTNVQVAYWKLAAYEL